MIAQIIQCIIVFLLMLSIVDVFKELFFFMIALYGGFKVQISHLNGWLLALSIAYILTFIFV